SQSAHGPEGVSTTGGRGAGRDPARPRHVHQCRRTQFVAAGRAAEVPGRRLAEDPGHHSAAWPEGGRAPEWLAPVVEGRGVEAREAGSPGRGALKPWHA